MSGLIWAIVTLGLGLTAGVLSGMFGIGGGLVIVPALIGIFGFKAKTAVGTSLFALMWPVGLLGVITYWRRGEMDPIKGLWIAVGLFVGAFFGAKITGAISDTTMKRLYACFLLVMAFYLLFQTRDAPLIAKRPAATIAPPVESSDQVH